MHALSLPLLLILAQGPGQLPAQSYTPVFDAGVGHTPNIQEVTLSGGSTVVIEYDAATYTLSWPDHRGHQRTFWLKNTGSTAVGPTYFRIKNATGATSYGAGLSGGLAPGERVQVAYLFAWDRIKPDLGTCDECFDQIAGQEFVQNWSILVFQCDVIAQDGSCVNPTPPSATVPQNFVLRVQNVAQRPKSATVRGRVTDAVTGRDIANAVLEVVNPSGEVRKAPFSVSTALTGQGTPAGNYTLSVPAMTALVRCEVPGYQTQYRVVDVSPGQTVTVDIAMPAMPWTASYTLTSTIQTGGLWGWAQTPNGQQAVFTPALSGNIVLSDAYARMINLSDGSVAWTHFLGAESMSPSVSPDNAHVALPVHATGAPDTASVRILNRTNGTLLFSRAVPAAFNPMSTAFSPDGTRLAVGGSSGQVWMLDTATYSTLWITQLQGQTRAVAWSPDSQRVYATSDPSVYALSRANGSVIWRTYTTSFAYQDNISQTTDGTRIAISAKFGGFLILDNNGNDIFREGARDGGGHAALAAPDGSFFVSTAGTLNGAHVLNPTGRLYWWSNHTSEGTAITADNKFLLLGASLYELGGTMLWTNATAEAAGPHSAVISPDKQRIIVAGEQGIYTFSGQVCQPTVSSTSAYITASGGSGSISVTVSPGCSWTAVSEDSFISLTGSTSGTGNGTVPFSVPAGSATRRGYLRIAGWPITVQQSLFSDEPLVAGTTTVKAAHLTELRQHINTLRARHNLATISDWTDATVTAGVTTIKAAHILELRSALHAAYVAASITPPIYSSISAGSTLISASHIAEIRAAILVIY